MSDAPPEELGEYHYYVSGMEMTAQMTPSMAEKMGAVPIDQPLDEDPDNLENNEANRLSSHMQDADKHGVQRPATGGDETDPEVDPETGRGWPQRRSRTAKNKRD